MSFGIRKDKRHREAYEFVKKTANLINKYFENKYLVFDEYGHLVEGKFIIEDDIQQISLFYGNNVSYVYFGFENPEMTKFQFKRLFAKWKFVNPKDIQSLSLEDL